MNYKSILLGVIVIIILYLVYVYVFSDSSSTILYSGGNAKKQVVIPAKSLTGNPASVEFTYSIWIYVNNWQYGYGQGKTIFRRKNKSGNVSPSVSLSQFTNNLAISFTTYNPKTSGTQSKSWNINNIPIQRWCNVILASNNRAIDTYVDGKLVNTKILNGVPKIDKQSPVQICPDGGFSGEVAKFKYYARTLSPREAYQVYREGPGGDWFSDLLGQYRVKFSFLKRGEEINSFEI